MIRVGIYPAVVIDRQVMANGLSCLFEAAD
jgi:hypothetical protein